MRWHGNIFQKKKQDKTPELGEAQIRQSASKIIQGSDT